MMKTYKIKAVFFLFLIIQFFIVEISAQNVIQKITVSGTVKDVNKQPVGGVLVDVQERIKHVVTGIDGSFSIEANNNDDIISFSKDGYKTHQIVATSSIDVEIIMETSLPDDGENDKVYIPFGVRTRRQTATAISSINGDAMSQTPNSSFFSSLYGKLPGLFIQQTGTIPGRDDFSLLIRGRSSLNDAQPPLVLVDGITRDLRDMDVSEIESVSILKDAGSLAWYGIRSGNGIIYVTTKTGSSNKTVIRFNAFGGIQMPEDYTKSLDSYTYATLYNEGRANAGQLPAYSQAMLNSYQNKNSDPFKYPNNNLPNEFINKSASVQHYDFSISGGNSVARYFALLSYNNQGGLFAETKTPNYNTNPSYNRINFRLNLNFNVSKNFEISTRFGGRPEIRREPGGSSDGSGVGTILSTIYQTPPNAFPIINPDNSLGGTSIFQVNPIGLLQSRGFTNQLTRILLADISGKYKLDDFVKGLSLNAQYSLDMSGMYTYGRTMNYEVYSRDTVTNAYTRFGTKAPLAYQTAGFSGNQRNSEFWGGFDYLRSFGNHNVDIALRYTNRNIKANYLIESTRNDAAGRFSYNFNQTYLIDFVASYSGQPYFAPGHRYGLFPALTAGWIISNAEFLKTVKPISYLKLRGSYGLTGYDAYFGSRRYPEQYLYDGSGYTWAIGSSYTVTGSGFREATLPNINATFEKVKKLDFGFDSKFFNQTLTINFDYFSEKRTDIFTNSNLPAIIGNAVFNVNQGVTEYKGAEVMLDYTKTFGKIEFSLFGNLTLAKSNIVKFNDTPGIPDYQLQVGHPVGNMGLLYQAIGIFQSQDEIDNAPVQLLAGSVKPGDIRYQDMNNDNKINADDRIRSAKNGIPESYYSFGAKLGISGFDLTASFSGVTNVFVNINSVINNGTSNSGYINQFSVDRWTPATAATSQWPRILISDRGNNTAASTFWIRSGDYLRLKNVELGYTLPTKVADRLKIGSLRVFISGYNLLTFSNLNNLKVDPEILSAGYGSSYPYLVSFSAGINLKF